MHDQERRAGRARVVKAVDRFARDEGEGACSGGVSLLADAQHQLAFEDVEELVALAMIVVPRLRCPARLSQTHPTHQLFIPLVAGRLAQQEVAHLPKEHHRRRPHYDRRFKRHSARRLGNH